VSTAIILGKSTYILTEDIVDCVPFRLSKTTIGYFTPFTPTPYANIYSYGHTGFEHLSTYVPPHRYLLFDILFRHPFVIIYFRLAFSHHLLINLSVIIVLLCDISNIGNSG